MVKTDLALRVSWMGMRHLPAVVAIERRSFRWPWPRREFIRFAGAPGCILMVIEAGDRPVAYIAYQMQPRRFELYSVAVDPDFRRRGVGRGLIELLKGKLQPSRRRLIGASVREANLDAQLWLRACGFRCVTIVPDHYRIGGHVEDAYRFVYRCPSRVGERKCGERR